jgi:hypothetical protein
MILSILLIVILLGLLYVNYSSDLHISKKILMLLVFILVCHGCMNNIKFELLNERFTNLQRNKEHFTNSNMREELTIVSPNYEDVEDKEFLETRRDNYQDVEQDDATATISGSSSSGENASANNEFTNNTATIKLLDVEREINKEEVQQILKTQQIQDTQEKFTDDELEELNSTMKSNDENFEGFKDTKLNKKKDKFTDKTASFVRSKTTKAKKEQDAAQSGSTVIKQEKGKGISSIFSPQIIIKEGDHDGVYFKKSESSPEVPISTGRNRRRKVKNWQEPEADLWADSHQYYDGHESSRDPWNSAVDNWNKSMGSCKNGTSKDCGNYVEYDTLRKKPDKKYQKGPKQFYPGYSYLPPTNWDVPQKRAPICVNNNPDTTKLPIGIADHGTPINALEVDPIGRILSTEEMVKHTNVGSILPKFKYDEET